MTQKSLSLNNETIIAKIPEKLRPRYIIHRIKGEDIEISWEVRNLVLSQIAEGRRFVQIREFTVMVNSINGIDPMYGEPNIPPRPNKHIVGEYTKDGKFVEGKIANQEEIDEWDKYYGGEK